MNTDLTALLALFDLFYQKAFTFEKAEELFGPVAEDGEDTVLLRPPANSMLASVVLEKLRPKPDGDPFLAGISIDYKRPIQVDFAALAQRYGPEVEMPRLKPRQDIPYRFLIKGADYSGYLLCSVPYYADTKAARRKVSSLILRRFPVEQT